MITIKMHGPNFTVFAQKFLHFGKKGKGCTIRQIHKGKLIIFLGVEKAQTHLFSAVVELKMSPQKLVPFKNDVFIYFWVYLQGVYCSTRVISSLFFFSKRSTAVFSTIVLFSLFPFSSAIFRAASLFSLPLSCVFNSLPSPAGANFSSVTRDKGMTRFQRVAAPYVGCK